MATHSVNALGTTGCVSGNIKGSQRQGSSFQCWVQGSVPVPSKQDKKKSKDQATCPHPGRSVWFPGWVWVGGRGSQVGSKALPESPLNSLDDDISNKGGAAAEGKTWQELPSSQIMFSQKCLVSLLEVRKCFLAIILHIPVFPSVFIPDPISPHLLHPLLAVSKRCQ